MNFQSCIAQPLIIISGIYKEYYGTYLKVGGSVAAKFEYTAYSKLAAAKISNFGIFEVTYVNSKLPGHFVAG